MVLILRARIRRFFEVLDAEAVGLFQVVFYLWFIAGALYLLFLTTTPSATIDASLPPPIAGGWAVSMLVGPLLCVGGKAAHGGLAYTGMLAQFVGDVVCGGAILTYMTAVAAGTPFGTGVFAPFLAGATFTCLVLLTIRDVRRFLQVEREVRR